MCFFPFRNMRKKQNHIICKRLDNERMSPRPHKGIDIVKLHKVWPVLYSTCTVLGFTQSNVETFLISFYWLYDSVPWLQEQENLWCPVKTKYSAEYKLILSWVGGRYQVPYQTHILTYSRIIMQSCTFNSTKFNSILFLQPFHNTIIKGKYDNHTKKEIHNILCVINKHDADYPTF